MFNPRYENEIALDLDNSTDRAFMSNHKPIQHEWNMCWHDSNMQLSSGSKFSRQMLYSKNEKSERLGYQRIDPRYIM